MMDKKATNILASNLVKAGLVTDEQIKEALAKRGKNKSFAQALSDCGYLSEKDFAMFIAKTNNLPFVDLANFRIKLEICGMIPQEMVKKKSVLPIKVEGKTLFVAMTDPSDVIALDDISVITGYEVKPAVAIESDLLHAINRYCRGERNAEKYLAETFGKSEESGGKMTSVLLKDAEERDAPIIELVESLIRRAVAERASDIHFEPDETDFRVRLRIDGVLQEIMTYPKRIQPLVISRLKLISGIDIAEQRKPQDGRFGMFVNKSPIDFRVASLPGVFGEKVVIRILRKESTLISLEELGFLPKVLEKFKNSFNRPYGEILITGPTGSGKSTSLYATLNILNNVEKKIITIEDPVEYKLNGLSQMQINVRAGLTFASGLRSILRADPDIIMVGEIRDRETAMICTEAALTGHLVLSTLHTNDASSAVTRLIEMEIEPFLISSVLNAVLAQRLARRLCDECKVGYNPSSEIRSSFGLPPKKKFKFYKAKGCAECNKTGYRGRIGLFELMVVSETIAKMAIERANSDDIKRVAIEEGMMTLRDDGLEKVTKGLTSLEEMMRVVV
ncbi:MAG: ATPase, T2SS/T4P/T4SS family [Actinomycetota bacterium]|nr:ATPase, T2SS/T4P/T4SS family [Actinomycetota bacterium]